MLFCSFSISTQRLYVVRFRFEQFVVIVVVVVDVVIKCLVSFRVIENEQLTEVLS